MCVNSVQYNYSDTSLFFTVIRTLIDTLYYPTTDINTLLLDRGGEQKRLSFNVQMVLFFMFLHQARRCFESFYINEFGTSHMHLGHFIYGLFYYTSLPILTLHYNEDTNKGLEWYHGIALMVFTWASWHQHICHLILASLKREQLMTGQYSLPEGDLFKYLICPHYTMEILIYCSLFICSGLSNYFLLLPLISALLSLSIVARETRVWYMRNFKGFPSKKFAIIPMFF